MQKPLAQIFNETAKEAAEAFPGELARLAVVVSGADNPLAFVTDAAAKTIHNDPAALDKSLEGIAERLTARGAVSYTRGTYDLGGTWVNLIAVQDSKNIDSPFYGQNMKDMQAVYILDYQLARHIVDNALSLSKNKAESACDAFAVLRHIQRYGQDTGLAALHNGDTAANMILFANTAHYTAETVRRTVAVAHEMGDDLRKLPLRETAKLAAEIAEESYLDSRQLKKLKTAFQPVAEHCAARLGGAHDIFTKLAGNDPQAYDILCRETLAVVEKHPRDDAVVRAGKQLLSHAPLKTFVTAQAAAGDPFYQKALGLLKAPDPQMPKKRRLKDFLPKR